MQFDASGDVAVPPVVAPGTPAHPAAFVEYYLLDAIGSVRAVTAELGTVLSRHDFLPFGEEWARDPTSPACAEKVMHDVLLRVLMTGAP